MSTACTRVGILASAFLFTVLSVMASPAEARVGTPSGALPTVDAAIREAGSAERDRFEARVLRLTNAARGHSRKCGDKRMKKARALSWSPTLASSAHAHSVDMASNDFFSHTSRSGASPFDRMRAAGYRHRPLSENIAAGLNGPAAVVEAWLGSPGHCQAIMDGRARELGVGRVEGLGEYGVYWTQDFGARK